MIAALKRPAKLARRHLVSISIVTACAVLGALTAALSGNVAVSTLDRMDSWKLPKAREAVLATDIDTILALPLFGGDPFIEEIPEIEDPDSSSDVFAGDEWRLIGIVTEGDSKHVVIFNDTTGKTVTAELGQTLPGGEELVAIRANDIEILNVDKRKRLSLFVDAGAEDLE